MRRRHWVIATLAVAGWTVAVLAASSLPAQTAEPLSRDQIWTACTERLVQRPSDAWLQGCVAAMAPDPTPSATPAPSTVPSRPPASTPPASTTPAGTSAPPPTTTSSPTPPAGAWPNPSNTGVPAGWTPTATRSNDLRITASGTVVQDLRLINGADIIVDADDVIIRRVELLGGRITNRPGTTCRKRLLIEQSTLRRPAGTVTDADQEGRIEVGGYTADRVHLDGVTEGFRVGGQPSCSTTTITNTFVRIQAPDVCRDWHGDGVQGYGGGPLVVRNVVIDFQERGGCGGTAPFFYPSGSHQGNTGPVTIDRLVVRGGGYSFRNGHAGRITNLHIVDGSWGYGPLNVKCSVVSPWQASLSRVDAAWIPTAIRALPCNTEDGS